MQARAVKKIPLRGLAAKGWMGWLLLTGAVGVWPRPALAGTDDEASLEGKAAHQEEKAAGQEEKAAGQEEKTAGKEMGAVEKMAWPQGW